MSSWIEYTAPKWRDLQMRDLKVDEAYLVPISEYDDEVYIYSLSDECYTCPFAKVKAILANDTVEPLKINVAHPISFKVFDKNVGRYAPNNLTALCTMQSPMDEFGVYNFSINSDGSCAIETDKPGVNVNLSIVSVVFLGIFITVIVKLVLFASKRFRTLSASEVAINGQDQENNDKTVIRKKRVLSIDTFRGLAIALMIFANSGGGGYWWIEHAPWNGLHLADLVFPFFLWVMGVCLPISIKSELSRGSSKQSLCQKIVWRSIKMFLIGVCLNSVNGPQLANLRIMGVLQRIAVAYLVAGVFYTLFAKKEYVLPQPQSRFMQPICELILLKEHIIFMLLLVAISLGIMFGIPAPGCPRGYIGPGGKDSYAANPDCIGGIIGYIDRKILGASHIYQYPAAMRLYDAEPFDPEGVFGCLLTIVHAVLGVICGCIMIMHTEWLTRMKRWACWGFVLGISAGILCLFSKENGWIPLNKNLWSLSFVLATSSLAFFLLTILYYVIDVREICKGFPFSECGKNAIILYVGHSVFHKMLPWHWVIGPMNTHFILLLRATSNTTLWVATAVYLDKIKFYYTL